MPSGKRGEILAEFPAELKSKYKAGHLSNLPWHRRVVALSGLPGPAAAAMMSMMGYEARRNTVGHRIATAFRDILTRHSNDDVILTVIQR